MNTTLIIEAGATKTDAVFVSADQDNRIRLDGINPAANPGSEAVLSRLPSNGYTITQIFYYGAGVRNESVKKMLTEQLKTQYVAATKIVIADDLQAAANAMHTNGKHIVSILGTGSSSGLFDGTQLLLKIPSPGYLFADEGSAFAAGKLILQQYFMKDMNHETRSAFELFHSATAEQILNSIYSSSTPNKTIAESARFLADAPDNFKDKTLAKCFEAFFVKRIQRLAKREKYKLNFVGSMAYHYQKHLSQAADKFGYEIGKIIEKPLDGLVQYHQNIDDERNK